MQKAFININSTTGQFTSGGSPIGGMEAVNGDNVLFAVEFDETPTGGTAQDLDLTGATSLRMIARSARNASGKLWTFQSTFNNGDYPTGEDLSAGKVSWLVSLAPQLYTITGVNDGAGGSFEIAGDLESQISSGDEFSVTGSTNNNASWEVNTVVHAAGTSTVTVIGSQTVGLIADGVLNHSALTNALKTASTAGFVDGWMEFSWVDASSNPQTLGQMVFRVFGQLDDGAVGVPVPTSPTYLTAAEIAAAYIQGAGTVVDNTVARFDGTSGSAIQSSPVTIADNGGIFIAPTGVEQPKIQSNVNHTSANQHIIDLEAKWDGTSVASVELNSGPDIGSKDDGRLLLRTAKAGTLGTRLYCDELGNIKIGDGGAPSAQMHIESQSATTETLRLEMAAAQTADMIAGVDSSGNEIFIVSAGGDIDLGNNSTTGSKRIQSKGNQASSDQAMLSINTEWNGQDISLIQFLTGADTVNKDDGYMRFWTYEAASANLALKMAQDGTCGFNTFTPLAQVHIVSKNSTKETLRLEMASGQTASPMVIKDNGGTTVFEIDENGDIVTGGSTSSNLVQVNVKADLPTPSAGSITLVAGTEYMINADIALGTDRIITNGARLVGRGTVISKLTYTGTGDMLTATNVDLVMVNLALVCASGTVFNVSGTGAENFSLYGVVMDGIKTIGTIDDVAFCSMVRTGFLNATTGGMSLTGTISILAFRNSFVFNNAGIALDLSGATAISTVNINFVNFTANATQTALKGVTDSTNISDYMRLTNCDFNGAGTYLNTLTRCDPPLLFEGNIGNSGTEDSTPKGGFYIADTDEAATTIATQDVPVVVAGTWTENTGSDMCKFDDNGNPGDGQMQYIGTETITASIGYKMLLDPASGSNKTYWVHVRKNGSTLDLMSRDEVTADAANPSKIVGITDIELVNGDYLELVVENKTDTTNVTASAASLIIRG